MIITLTSDFGLRDYYVAAMKAALLSRLPVGNHQLVDVTHEVAAHDLVGAAYQLGNVWRAFPSGSLHLVSVQGYYQKNPRFVLARHEEHWFVAPDNGFFSLLFDTPPTTAYWLDLPEKDGEAMSLHAFYAQTAAALASGAAPETLGPPANGLAQRIALQPVSGADWIRGVVVHVDGYENVITNIPRALFERVGQGRAFALSFKRHEPIQTLSRAYADVPIGETLCRFNAAGLLEIAVHLGLAATLHGLQPEDGVQVVFWENS
jgi:S-adenosylmethionine hydrolase